MSDVTRSLPALLIRSMPGCRTLSAGVWVTHGAAHDPERLAGATHLVEHLTLRRCGDRSRQQLSTLVDRLGGEVDAWTSSESMGITVHTTADATAEALDLLVDAIMTPTFDREDVELERRVTLAELELVADDPAEQVEEAILAAAWGDHPLARPVIGTADTLNAMTAAELRRHHRSMLRPGRVLAAVVGDVDEEAVAARLDRLPLSQPVSFPELPPLVWAADHRQVQRPSVDQVHVRLAFPGLPSGHPRLAALSVLNRLLGVGASSRLFQRLREGEGLTYDIWSGLMVRGDGGLLDVGWVCAPGVLAEVRTLVAEEIAGLLAGVTGDEVEVAKESLARGLVMDAESPAGVCSMEVGELLERGRRFDLDQVLGELAAVTPAEVDELARELLRSDRMATALCGPEGLALRVA